MDAFGCLCGIVALMLIGVEIRDRVRNLRTIRDRARERERIRLESRPLDALSIIRGPRPDSVPTVGPEEKRRLRDLCSGD